MKPSLNFRGGERWWWHRPVAGFAARAFGSIRTPRQLRGRDILEAALAALGVALLLKLVVVDFCYVPSLSMAPTLLPGDYVFISRVAYAVGVPERLPLLGVRLPQEVRWWYRFPQRWDIIVLDFPGELSQPESPQYYIKRIVGLPGDTVGFAEDTLFINRTAYWLPGLREKRRRVVVPARGMVIPLSARTLPEWMPVLLREGLHIDVQRGTVYLDGQPSTEYRVRQDYVFVMGDNYRNSSDSRHWGVVPQSAIVGKAVAIYYSVDRNGQLRWSRLGRLLH